MSRLSTTVLISQSLSCSSSCIFKVHTLPGLDPLCPAHAFLEPSFLPLPLLPTTHLDRLDRLLSLYFASLRLLISLCRALRSPSARLSIAIHSYLLALPPRVQSGCCSRKFATRAQAERWVFLLACSQELSMFHALAPWLVMCFCAYICSSCCQ